jgi:hypothetical protein
VLRIALGIGWYGTNERAETRRSLRKVIRGFNQRLFAALDSPTRPA